MTAPVAIQQITVAEACQHVDAATALVRALRQPRPVVVRQRAH